MDTLNHIKPASLKEAFGVDQSNSGKSSTIFIPDEQHLEIRKAASLSNHKEINSDETNVAHKNHHFLPGVIKDISGPAKKVEQIEVQPFFMPKNEIQISSNLLNSENIVDFEPTPFIIANTKEVSLHHLSNECIIPVFSKDNERTISHHEFIGTVVDAIRKIFPNQNLANPEIRISHEIKGRVVSAIHKSAKDLLEEDKTLYYERMAFIIRIPGIVDTINGNKLTLTVGGVRAYNHENLYGKKTLEKFRFFVGFQNQVCMNMCISTDGFLEDLRASTTEEL